MFAVDEALRAGLAVTVSAVLAALTLLTVSWALLTVPIGAS